MKNFLFLLYLNGNHFLIIYLNNIKKEFKNTIIVRSSSIHEDGNLTSNAGMFHSELNVNPHDEKNLTNSINKVVKSYQNIQHLNPNDQILVQSQTKDVQLSGVLFTRDINQNSPYYVINYDESNKTDTVTSGRVSKNIRIARNAVSKIKDVRWKTLLKSINEIELLLDGLALDIEFALNNKNEVIIFQVRPLAAVNKFVDIDDKIIFNLLENTHIEFNRLKKLNSFLNTFTLSDMSFWNPAEIIGSRSDELSYSLYHYLILYDSWTKGLSDLGYKKINKPLMVRLLNKPYICVELAFKALLPEGLSASTEKN